MANDIGNSIWTYTLAQSSVTAIVADRGYPDVLPQNCVLPAFTYEVVSDTPDYHLTGTSTLRQARLQITCFADTRRMANQLDEAILAVLDFQKATLGGTPVRTLLSEERSSSVDGPVDGSDKWRYLTFRDYLIWYIP